MSTSETCCSSGSKNHHSHSHHSHDRNHSDEDGEKKESQNNDEDLQLDQPAHDHKHAKSHDHDHGHHDDHKEELSEDDDDEDGVTCLAVVRDDGAEISLFDAKGQVRSFSYKGDMRNLCFSSHGQDADDLLTPCFDDDGNHGTPDEGCFCGVDTPHLHAHLHDPKTCNDDDDDDDNNNKNNSSEKASDMEAELMKLARLTLHPVKDDNNDIDGLYQIPVSENMPKECNSKAFTRHMSGADHSGHLYNDTSTHTPPVPFRKQRMHKVQHDDHFDYLVHNKTTGELHLEHPCDSCGDHDYHGKFRLVGKRKWQSGSGVQLHIFEPSQRRFNFLHLFEPESSRVATVRQATKPSCCSRGSTTPCHTKEVPYKEKPSCCSKGSTGTIQSNSHAHSTKAEAESTCCSKGACSKNETVKKEASDCCSSETAKPSCCSTGTCTSSTAPTIEKSTSCCSSGTCSTKASAQPHSHPVVFDKGIESGNIARSTFVCTKICCSSEIPMIDFVLKPVTGIRKIMVNVPLKNVIVDHDSQVISATEICKLLDQNRFGATLQRDGGLAGKRASTGRSRFFVEKICCASEIPAIESIVSPLVGVSNVMINVTTKTVYVDHEFDIITAKGISDALNEEAFGARVEHDAATERNAASSFVTSILSFDATENDAPSTENLTDFLKTYAASKIETFVVNLPSQKITVVHNPLLISANDIVAALAQKTGLEAKIEKDGKESQVWKFPEVVEEEAIVQPSTRPRPTVILSGVFWIVSMLSLIGGNWDFLKYVALLSVAFGLPPIAVKAARTLRRFQFDTNCLMFFAAVGALALQEFTEAAAVTFLFAISEWLEVRATSRARMALSSIVQLRPESANLVHPQTGEIVLVPVTAVPVGALVSVRTGDKIPCDGVVVEGSSTVDESSLTGESRPVRKRPKDAVSGGTINSGHTQIMVRTTSTADDSAVARLIRLVEEAQANRSETEKLVDEFARIYTPFVVLAALLMCTIPWAWGQDTGAKWTHNGLVLIVIACPCALIISTPIAYVAGLAATAQRGVLIKGGAHLETLGSIKTVCFDKTGTLTQGKFQLLHLNVIGEKRSRPAALEFLSLMEERASHPLAQALIDAARREGVKIPKELFVKDHTFLAGEGVSGVINGLKVYVGNTRLFRRLGLYETLIDSERKAIEDWETAGGTVGFMSIGEEGIVCTYCVADAVRPEAAQVLDKLKRMRIGVTMLTGDNADAARAIGFPIGLADDEIKSQLLPEEKLSIVSEMKDDGGGRSILANLCSSRDLVLMCGDGVNDAPALAIADVGVAMGAGAALAMETADVTLMDSNLEKLVYAITMGRRVIRKIKQNVVFSISVKFLVLGFALSGKAYLWAAIASDVGAMILVTINGMLLLPSQTKKYNPTATEEIKSSDVEKGAGRDLMELNDKNDIANVSEQDTSKCNGGDAGHCCSHRH